MLEPQERRLLHEALRPPVGFELSYAIATTYSLDLVTLLAVPLAFTSFDADVDEGGVSPLALLESARRHSERISVYCQAGRIAYTTRAQSLFEFLERSIVEVSAPIKGGSFHPKVWVLRYESPTEGIRYRILCLSRNLTGTRTWDVSLVLDGQLTDRLRGFARNAPIADFVAALPSLARRGALDGHTRRAAMIARELRVVDFTVPERFDDFAFVPLGLGGRSAWPLGEEHERLLIISPFVTTNMASKLAECAPRSLLVSRVEQLDRVESATLERFESVWVLDSAAEASAAGAGPEEETLSEQREPAPFAFGELLSGLHAKVYVAESAGSATLWLGSANATDAGFGANVELLVKLSGRTKVCGIDAVLTRGETEPGLLDLLAEYKRSEHVLLDEIAERLEERLEQARRALAESSLAADVSGSSAAKSYRLVLRRGATDTSLPGDVLVRAWPITLPYTAAQRWDDPATSITFDPLTLIALTSFIAIECEARLEGRVGRCCFVVNVPLSGAPAGRRAAVMQALLTDRAAVSRFLLMLLLGDEIDPAMPSDVGAGTGRGRFWEGTSGEPLLEALLTCLHRNPERLDHVAEIVETLRETEGGEDRLPRGFDAAWPAIWEARQALRVKVAKV